MKPTISIIIPALNEESNIKPTVNNVLAALEGRFSNYELLIFNDGSTDRTGIVADALAASDKNIKVIHNEKNMGFGYNYKKGVELAKNDYIAMIPGDNEISGDSVKDIFGLVGKANIIIPYTLNFWVRPFFRQLISRAFTNTMNLLFGLSLKYYNGPAIHKRKNIKNIPLSTSGYAFQAEILTRLIKSGYSYVEVGMNIRKRDYGVTKAFKLKNVISVLKTVAKLIWEIWIKERRKYNKPLSKIELKLD